MKKFLVSVLSVFLLSLTVSAQNTYITPVSASRGARVTVNEPTPSTTFLTYTYVQRGHTLMRTPSTTSTDSCVLKVDTTSCELGVKRVNGTATGYLKLDSASTLSATTSIIQTSALNRVVGRISTPLGTAVASANNLAVGTGGSSFNITGTTTINLIDTTGFVDGDQIVLVFNGSLTVSDSTAASGVYAPINLSGGSNLSATKNDVLTLMVRRELGKASKEWWEVSRTVNAD